MPRTVNLIYIGSSTFKGKEYAWTIKTLEIAMEQEYIYTNREVLQKLQQLDPKEYKVLISFGAPIKKFNYYPDHPVGIETIDNRNDLDKKIYIYIIKYNIKILHRYV